MTPTGTDENEEKQHKSTVVCLLVCFFHFCMDVKFKAPLVLFDGLGKMYTSYETELARKIKYSAKFSVKFETPSARKVRMSRLWY